MSYVKNREKDNCVRDFAGFCLLALYGWPKCFRGRDHDRCDENDPKARLEDARQQAIKSTAVKRTEGRQ